jgi:Zn-dependent M28 family amino/carboxypeptidase
MIRIRLHVVLLVLLSAPLYSQTDHARPGSCELCIRAHEEFLASDVLGGRGSGTRDELLAATYIASQLRQYGVEPAGTSYIQNATIDLKGTSPRFQRLRDHLGSDSLETYNVVGMLPGSDPQLKDELILLSAHLDHLGTIPQRAVKGDAIFNGADDDASGVTAVLELARALASGPKPKRTVLFAFFGSEELGGLGATYFLQTLNFPLTKLVANLEFEMIGRSDAAVAPHTLWLTGFERSDLGPELAKHGARLVADPHPSENFFRRSDNYVLAKKGVIAHTVSSYGLHKDYHQPSDDLAHLDIAHMTEAIGSMIEPVEWLVNSDFRPKWAAGQQP